MAFFAGQKLRASELQDLIDKDSPLPLGLTARGNRTTSSTTTTTEVGVLRIDDVPMYAGRAYKIWTSPLVLDTSVNADIARGALRHTTDGSTPTTSSTLMDAGGQGGMASAANGETRIIQIVYVPAADELFSVLLTVSRIAGTGNISIVGAAGFHINVYIEDIGQDPGDTGVDI